MIEGSNRIYLQSFLHKIDKVLTKKSGYKSVWCLDVIKTSGAMGSKFCCTSFTATAPRITSVQYSEGCSVQ